MVATKTGAAPPWFLTKNHMASFNFFSMSATDYFRQSQNIPASLPTKLERVVSPGFRENAAFKKGDQFTSALTFIEWVGINSCSKIQFCGNVNISKVSV